MMAETNAPAMGTMPPIMKTKEMSKTSATRPRRTELRKLEASTINIKKALANPVSSGFAAFETTYEDIGYIAPCAKPLKTTGSNRPTTSWLKATAANPE